VQQLTVLESLAQSRELSQFRFFGTVALHLDEVEVFVPPSEVEIGLGVVQNIVEALFPVIVLSQCRRIALPIVIKIDVHPLRVVNAGSTLLKHTYPVFINISVLYSSTVLSGLFLR